MSYRMEDWLLVLPAYCMGCFSAGYYLVRWRTGEDIRLLGSGNAGARNVGRRLGTYGFGLTLAADCLKGAAAVAAARALGLERDVVTVMLLAVIAGHIWPVQLRFRGGKGIATSLGGLLVYDPRIVLLLMALFALTWLATRKVTIAGVLAYAAGPPAVFLGGLGPWATFAMLGSALLIVPMHRANIRSYLHQAAPERQSGVGDAKRGEERVP
jgi:glycerol-3-phosphate acyltransferase PlsY